jgi:hypothetical protein
MDLQKTLTAVQVVCVAVTAAASLACLILAPWWLGVLVAASGITVTVLATWDDGDDEDEE